MPTAGPIPGGDWRGVVALCQYSRGTMGPAGLVGSRQLTGTDARALVGAINDAPVGGGPDRPQNCTHDHQGDSAVLLRFLPPDGTPEESAAVPEAHLYYDWCFGNGIVNGEATRELTRANCRPVFAEPPVTIWSAQSNVAGLCWS